MSRATASQQPDGAQHVDATSPLGGIHRVRVALSTQSGLVVVILLGLYWVAAIGDVWSRILWLGWMGNALVVAQVWNLRRAFGTIASPAVMFTLLLALFTLGQVMLYTVGVVPEDADVLNRENPESVARALTFFLPAYAFFTLGILTARLALVKRELMKHEGQRRQRSNRPSRADWREGVAFSGLVFLAVGALPFLWSNLRNLGMVWSGGYSSYYEEGARINSPLVGLGYFFITGLVLIGCSDKPSHRRAAIVLLTAVSAMRLLSGDRGEGLIYLITALMIAQLTKPEGAPRRRFGPIVVGLFSIAVIPMIGILRHSVASGEGSVGEAFQEENPLTGTLSNLGATLHPLVKTIELVPGTQDHIGGSSYLASLAVILPGGLRVGGLGSLVSDPLTGSPATWLMQTLGMSYGPGFTPFAEGYLNFGNVGGCIALFGLGLLMGRILHTPSWDLPWGPIGVAVALAAFALIGFSVRGSFNYVPSFFIRYVLIPALLAGLSANTYRRRRLRKEATFELDTTSNPDSRHHQLVGGWRSAEESDGNVGTHRPAAP